MIDIKKLSKKLDGVMILENINLHLQPGKIYGFVGLNGSGKSVFFKLLCAFMDPDIGEIEINGKNIKQKDVISSQVRALIEKPHFIGNITGRENLLLLAGIQKKIGEKEIDEFLTYFQLKEDKQYRKYSLGMKQKLGIIQTIMENPDIMIFDEPFNGLDENSVGNVKKLLLEKKSEGKTILLATHIQEEIDSLCDVVYKIDSGNISKLVEKK